MKFYDLDIQSNISTGTSTPEQIAHFAEELGFAGIAICDVWAGTEKFQRSCEAIEKVRKAVGIEVLPGVKVVARNPNEMRNAINKLREKAVIVCVAGGDYQINRAACENSKVDILCHPSLGRTDNGLDESCLNAAAANNVAIEINFREVLNSYRRPRSIILNNILTNIRLCQALHAPLIVCSGAQSVHDMRDPRELISIANVLGLELSKSFSALSDTPARIIETNKKKLLGKIAAEGVEIL